MKKKRAMQFIFKRKEVFYKKTTQVFFKIVFGNQVKKKQKHEKETKHDSFCSFEKNVGQNEKEGNK
jgi:hypothetical protein